MPAPYQTAVLIGLLCAACIAAGCTMPFQSQENTALTPALTQKIPINIGSTSMSSSGDFRYTSFNDALTLLQTMESDEGITDSATKSVYYLRGENVDTSGNAVRWMLGVRKSNQTSLYLYKHEDWVETPWSMPDASERIELDTITPPSALIQNSTASSQGDVQRRDLELYNGVYTLTITTPGSIQEYRYNAVTGALIPYQ